MRIAAAKLRGTLMGVVGLVLLAAPAAASATTSTFQSTGSEQTFTVPAGVTSVHVVAIGGKGGTSNVPGGYGTQATADLAVTPGQVLYVEVGQNGWDAVNSVCGAGGGGFNGGGNGGYESTCVAGSEGAGGGGASDVRTAPSAQAGSLSSRLIIAGGGGGGGGGASGGAAGYPDGQPGGGTNPGQPGTFSNGGAGGSGSSATQGHGGSQGQGGAGGGSSQGYGGGGGGGGGLYGGGGGAGGSSTPASGSGGGGGSSGVASGVTNPSVTPDTSGAPSITFTYTSPGSGGGGSGGGGGGAGSGGSGGGSGGSGSGTGGGTGGTGSGTGGTGGTGGGGGTASSLFTLTQPTISKTGVLTFSLNAPQAGTFTANATTLLPAVQTTHAARDARRHRPKRISYGSATAVAFHAGTVRLSLRPSGAARSALAKGQKLTVLVTIKFTPASGGPPTTHQLTVNVKGSKPGVRRHG